MLIIAKKSLVTVNVLFWMPNYTNLVQEFIWQTDDVIPDYPRVNKFLHFWQKEIDAVIKEIKLSDSSGYDISNSFQIYDRNFLWQ